MAHHVFISVSSQDRQTGDAVCAVLEAHGIRCWMAPRDIAPGEEWAESIIDAINDAHCMVLVFSGHANTSPQIRREVERAVNKGIPIHPLRIEDVQPSKTLEYFISTPQWLDAFTPPLERHLNRLAQAIQVRLDRAGKRPPPRPDPSPPEPDPQPAAPAQSAQVRTIASNAASVTLGPRPEPVPAASDEPGPAALDAVSTATAQTAQPAFSASARETEPSPSPSTAAEPERPKGSWAVADAAQLGTPPEARSESKPQDFSPQAGSVAIPSGESATTSPPPEPVLVTITNGKRRRLRKTALSLLIIVSILAAFGAVIISQLLDKTHQIAQVSTGANASGDAKVSTDGKVSSEAKALTSKGMAALEHSDYAQALTWFRKAADQGDAAAQLQIGLLYERGHGVPQDYAQALTWYRKASDQGYATAQAEIGYLYENGLGVSKDTKMARSWKEKAAANGDEIMKSWLAKFPP